MTQPKYKIGESVWMIDYDKVRNVEISAVASVESKIFYAVGYLEINKINVEIPESSLFPTKEDLIKSL